MATVACIGHTTVDLIFFLEEGHLHSNHEKFSELCLPFPDKLAVKRRVVVLGGNAPNVGAGLLKTGHQVKLVSQIGEDIFGDLIKSRLYEMGFDLTYTSIEGESDTSVILSYQGERTILSYHAGIRYRCPRDLKQTDWIYLSSLGLKNFSVFHQDLLGCLENYPGLGLIYNPGRNEIKSGFEATKGLVEKVHTLIVNKQEAEEFIKHRPVDFADAGALGAFFDEYVKRGVQRLVVTDGKNGAYYCDGFDNYYHLSIYPVEELVDSTGAGDAFSSGYLTALASGREPKQALRVAIVQSAEVLTQAGAMNGLLSLQEIDKKLEEYPDLRLQRIIV